MRNEFKELRNDIACSLYLSPCTEQELSKRDFLKNKSLYCIGIQLQKLDQLDATFYRGDVIHIRKSWAKINLKEYDLDFDTPKEKYENSLTDFAKSIKK